MIILYTYICILLLNVLCIYDIKYIYIYDSLPDKEYRDQTQLSVDDESPPPEKTRADLAASEKTEVPRTPGPRGELYAVPVRRRQPRATPPAPVDHPPLSDYTSLPPGWEKHEGNSSWYL